MAEITKGHIDDIKDALERIWNLSMAKSVNSEITQNIHFHIGVIRDTILDVEKEAAKSAQG